VDLREYDLFEAFPDGSFAWKEVVSGDDEAILRLRERAVQRTNELRVMDIRTNTIIAAR
jgi:hypothetical protein